MLALKCQFDKSEPNSKFFGITIGLQEMSFLTVVKSNTCLCMGKFLINFEAKFELEQSVIGLGF